MPAFEPSREDWGKLAEACSIIAERERARAAKMDSRTAADYLASAMSFENLAASCLRNCGKA
jgi:hypothetical protein